MKMSVELLVPGMQDGDKAGFAAEIILAEGQKCPGGGIEEDFQEKPLIGKNKGVEFMRQSEDRMKITDGQYFRLAGLQPAGLVKALALGAMTIPAGVVGRPLKAAAIAFFEMTAERGSAAALDSAHDLELRNRQGMRAAESLAVQT